jgi:hypothetical protein
MAYWLLSPSLTSGRGPSKSRKGVTGQGGRVVDVAAVRKLSAPFTGERIKADQRLSSVAR